MARGKRFKRGGNNAKPEPADAKVEQEDKQELDSSKELGSSKAPPKVAEAVADGQAASKGEDNVNSATLGKRKRPRFKKKGLKQTDEDVKETVKPKEDMAGLIFLCNKATRADCFKYRVFGLPEQKKNVIEGVKKGIKLFLFDIDQKLLYGVYKASSTGGMNLVPEAYQDSGKKFPAQVRFRIHKECMPLEEGSFKQAIKDNYFGRNKFKQELNSEQVRKLITLYRPLDKQGLPEPKPASAGKQVPAKKGKLSGVPPPRARGPPPRSSQAGAPPRPRQPLYPRDYALPPARERVPVETPYMPSQAGMDLLEAEALHRRRLQEAALLDPYTAPPLQQVGYGGDVRRRYDYDGYADESGLSGLLPPRRPALQDTLSAYMPYGSAAPPLWRY